MKMVTKEEIEKKVTEMKPAKFLSYEVSSINANEINFNFFSDFTYMSNGYTIHCFTYQSNVCNSDGEYVTFEVQIKEYKRGGNTYFKFNKKPVVFY